jgi:hypothetical protein
MNNFDSNSNSLVNMGREHWDVPVRVELRPYLDFTRRMNIQLRHLVERWERKDKKHKSRIVSTRIHRPDRPR